MMSPAELDAFYSEVSIEEWATVIGPGLHYHFGYFLDPKGTLFDETLETALRRTVEYFYPWIPEGARVLDIGCGWGGPAQMMIEDKAAEVTGVTISQAQAAYCRERGLSVEVLDVERDVIPGQYEVGFMLEVLEHIQDKRGLLTRLRSQVDRLLLSTGCVHETINEANRISFGGSLLCAKVSELRADLTAAGWHIESERNRRFNTLPTYTHWKRNLDRVYGDRRPPGQLGVLRDLAEASIQQPERLLHHISPLIDIVAV